MMTQRFYSIANLFFLLCTSSTQAEEVGRLFFTPDERIQLERVYAHQKAKLNSPDEAEGRPYVTVNGLIKRSDGSRIGWVNGKAQQFPANKDPNKVTVTIPGQNKPVEMKVGQRFLLDAPTTKAPSRDEDDE